MSILTITDDDSLVIPNWLTETNLTLAEIGAFIVFVSLDSRPNQEAWDKRIESPEMAEAMKTLNEKGVLKVSVSNNTLSFAVDLDPVTPEGIGE